MRYLAVTIIPVGMVRVLFSMTRFNVTSSTNGIKLGEEKHMETKKKEVRIAYMYHEYSVAKGCRNSDGRYVYYDTDTHCYGIFTDAESLNFTLQDYEVFHEIETKYRPQEHNKTNSGAFWNVPEDEIGNTSETFFQKIDKRFVNELNAALSDRLSIIFVEAEKKDKLPYIFNQSIRYELFNEFEHKRMEAQESISSEIKEINDEISKLQRRKDWLEKDSTQKKRCASYISTCLKKIVEQGRLDINEKISCMDMYPLQMAEEYHQVELYELLLEHGAKGYWGEHPLLFHSWYGFFILLMRNHDLAIEDVRLILCALYELSDSELAALLVDEEPHLCYKGLVVEDYVIYNIRDFLAENYYENKYCTEDMFNLIHALVKDRRYGAIKTIKEFLMYEPPTYPYVFPPLMSINLDRMLFTVCVMDKDLEALKELGVTIEENDINYDQEINGKYINEEYLGKEMMDYINTHKVKSEYPLT